MAEQLEYGYSDDETGRLELVWGEGFLSPGGPAEVQRILGGQQLSGLAVLDVGSGTGGVDITLVNEHGAATVVGVDVQRDLVDLAAARAIAAGVGDRISYQLVEPGPPPLPFAEDSFDVVFSKDSIIHVREKEALYQEAFRVLRPGGRLLVGDWLRGDGDGDGLDAQVDAFVDANPDFAMASPRDIEGMVERVGFVEVEFVERRSWYLEEAAAELEHVRSDLRRVFVDRWGEEATAAHIGFWEELVSCLKTGALCPTHIRARKPEPGSR